MKSLAYAEKNVIATIELCTGEGRAELYYDDGDIYCRRISDGAAWPTETGCACEADAPAVIEAAWGGNGALDLIFE